jgi:hypothetical protein
MFRRKKATTRILGRIQALLVVTRQQNNNHKITKHHRAFLTGIQSPSSSCDGREATEHGGLFLLESNRHLRRRRSTVCAMCDPARLANNGCLVTSRLAFLLPKPCWLISNTTRTSQQNATASLCVREYFFGLFIDGDKLEAVPKLWLGSSNTVQRLVVQSLLLLQNK